MVHFVIYRNSILATICSMIGAVCIAMAVGGMVGKEIGILPGIAMIAVGLGLMLLAGIISEHKEKKKKAKAAAKAANAQASASASNTGYAQPNVNTAYTQPQQSIQTACSSIARGKPVKKSAALAAILFLLAAALGIWACQSYNIINWNDMLNSEQVMLIPAGLMMMIGCFLMKKNQRVSALFLIGLLCLILGSIDVTLVAYRNYGFAGYSTNRAIHYSMYLAPAISAGAYLLMALLSLFSMEKIKVRMGGIVRVLWWLPAVLLAVGFVKWFDDNYISNAFTRVFYPRFIGLKYLPREFLEGIARIIMILSVFLSCFCFQRICRRPAAACAQVQYASAEPPAQERPVQPQPASCYAAPEPPIQPEPAEPKTSQQEVQKQIKAYKDLLDCGILTQEEYDQEIRKLM